MAITIHPKVAPSEYVLKSECDITLDAAGNEVSRTPQPGAASFRLRPLTDFERMDVRHGCRFDDEGNMWWSGAAAKLALRCGVLGWMGVRDPEGKEIPFAQAALEGLDQETIMDLAVEILRRSQLTENERKNS